MPRVPDVQPFDVFTPLAAAGQASATALKDIGSSVDTYNRMDQAMKDRNARRAIRAQLIQEAGLDDSALPPDMEAEDLAKLANKIKAAKDVIGEAIDNGGPKAIPSASEKRLIALAAGATDDAFWRAVGATQDAVAAYKKEKEGSGEGQRLQDVATGLQEKHEIPSLSSGSPKTTTLGSAEEPLPPPSIEDAAASRRMLDMQAASKVRPRATSPRTGEISQEGFYKGVNEAGIDVTKVGKERLSAAASQFRPEKDIEASGFKEANLRVARDRLNQAAKKMAQDATFKEFAIGFGTLVKNGQFQDARQRMFAESKKLRSDAEVLQSNGYEGAEEKIQAAEALESAFQYSEGNAQVLQDISSDMTGYLGKKYPQFGERRPGEERDAGIIETLKRKNPNWDSLAPKEQRVKIDEYKRTGGRGSQAQEPAAAAAGTVPIITNDAAGFKAYSLLKVGEKYIAPDGSTKVKK